MVSAGLGSMSASPLYASPLSQTFEPPSRSPSPQERYAPYNPGHHVNGDVTPLAIPIPVPVTPSTTRHHALLHVDNSNAEITQRHPSSIPSPTPSVALDGPISLGGTSSSHQPAYSFSPPRTARQYPSIPHRSPDLAMSSTAASSQYHGHPSTSRRASNSLAGSYTVSLLSSRMSATHPPHSVASAFVLQIGSTSTGRDVPSRLKCPPHEKIGFEGRWHDINQDTGGGHPGGAVMTPWVGNVDVEGHYVSVMEEDEGHMVGDTDTRPNGPGHGEISIGSPAARGRRRLQSPSRMNRGPSPTDGLRRKATSPPRFPGYELGSRGLLQLIVKNEFHALKVFLINYDLGVLEPGGRMLVRERGYQVLPAVESLAASPEFLGGSPSDRRRSSGSSYGASSSFSSPSHGRREILRFAVELQFICTEGRGVKQGRKHRKSTGGDVRTPSIGKMDISFGPDPARRTSADPPRAYYLTKHIRVIFPPSGGIAASGEAPSSGNNTSAASKPEIRTERFIEVINPAPVHIGMSPADIKKARRKSFSTESWEGVAAEWRQRMFVDSERQTRLQPAGSIEMDWSPVSEAKQTARSAGLPASGHSLLSQPTPFFAPSPIETISSFFTALPASSAKTTEEPVAKYPVSDKSLRGIANSAWNNNAFMMIAGAAGGTALTLGGIQCYRRFWRRIRNADYVTSGMLDRKKWVRGVVTTVGDGDNFRLFHTPGPFFSSPFKLRNIPSTPKELKDETLHIRIAGVDAPECAHFGRPSQPHSKESLDWLQALLLTPNPKKMSVQLLRKDQYGRIVGVPYIRRIFLPNIPLPIAMLQSGMAVVYESGGAEYGSWGIEAMKKVEAEAKAAKRGLWALPSSSFEHPAEYKKRYKVGEDAGVKANVSSPMQSVAGKMAQVVGGGFWMSAVRWWRAE